MTEKQPRQATISGLTDLYAFQQKSKADGKKIFDLVMQEEATAEALKMVVYQESLLQLIFYVLDHRKVITSRVNQGKSAQKRSDAAFVDNEKVVQWCNANPESAWLPYKSSVESAMAATNVLASTSVRDYISEWRKSNSKK